MITQELRTYVLQSIDEGHSTETIASELRTAGWEETEIAEALSLSAPIPPIPPPVQSIPLPEPVTPSLPKKAEPAEMSVAEKLAVQMNSSPLTTQSGVSGVGGLGKTKTLIIFTLIAVVLLSAGAVLGYVSYVKDPSPEDVFQRMIETMRTLDSVTGKGTLTITGTMKEKRSGGLYSYDTLVESEGKIIGLTRPWNERDGNVSLHIKGSASYTDSQTETIAFSISTTVRKVGDTFYVLLEDFPEDQPIAPFLGLIKGKWISFPVRFLTDRDYLSSEMNTLSPALLKEVGGSTAIQNTRSDAENIGQQVKDILIAHPLFVMGSAVKQDGVTPSEYRYTLNFSDANYFAVVADIKKLATLNAHKNYLFEEISEEGDSPEMSEAIAVLASILKPIAPVLWVSIDDALLRRGEVSYSFATSTEDMDMSATVQSNFSLSEHNTVSPILPPTENVVPATELIKSILPPSSISSSDEVRKRNVRDVSLALELYFDANQSYPLHLEDISPIFIPSIEVDPLDGKLPVYVPLVKSAESRDESICTKNPCLGYFLGVSLENASNTALKDDKDLPGDAATWSGKDDSGCRNEKGRYCYDFSE